MKTPSRIASRAGLVAGLAAAAVLLAPFVASADADTVKAEGRADVTAAAAGTVVWADAGASALTDPDLVRKPRFGRAAAEVIGLNLFVWSYDRFIREGGTNRVFRVGFNSWKENFEAGWTWDDNSFSTNQISHPYHGNLYFNAARSNGYDFWSSVPFAFAGSFTWEYFFETHNPAMNDWIATSVGGSAMGEILHRLALTVRDNSATGGSRRWREVGGLLIDPMGGVNRLFDGDWSRQYANPEDRFPLNYRTNMDLGLRTIGEEKLWQADTTRVYASFEFEYGDPFYGDLGKPYENFDFDLSLYFGDKTRVGQVRGSGNLAGTFLKDTPSSAHILAAYHHYDYVNTNALEYGGQSLTAALLSRWTWESGFELRTDLRAGPMILGGVSSDYASVSGRSYDYGPGTAVTFEGELRKRRWTWARLRLAHLWLHSISGNVADHQLGNLQARVAVPILAGVGLGAEYAVVTATNTYRDYPDVHKRTPQMRIFTFWGLN